MRSKILVVVVLALAASAFAKAPKRVMPWMCLERCQDTAADIEQQLKQIDQNKHIINAVSFEIYNLGAHSQLLVNNLTQVGPRLVEMGVETYAMVSSYPYPPEFMSWMRQLFADPDTFIAQCISEAKMNGWTGYNIDFEPTSEATAADGVAYAEFLDYFSEKLHDVGLKATADVAGWSPVWNYTALAASQLDRIITMSTYTGNFTSFKNAFNRAISSFSVKQYGCGLESINESVKPNKPFSYQEMLDRFQMIQDAGVTEIDIWRTPIPDNWWPLLNAWTSGSPLPPNPPM